MTSRRPYWCSKQILWELDSSYVKNFSCSHKFAWMLATWVNTLYTKNVKFERDLWTTNEEYRYAKSPNCVRGTRTQSLICFWCSVHYWVTCAINKGVFFEIAFSFVVDTHLPRFEGACLSFASLWRANSCGDSCVLDVHLSKVCY